MWCRRTGGRGSLTPAQRDGSDGSGVVATRGYNIRMKTVTIREAKNRLTELAREVERGETIVVTRNGSPVFEMAPHRPRRGLRLEAIEEFKRKRKKPHGTVRGSSRSRTASAA